jgi:hypothetical protein
MIIYLLAMHERLSEYCITKLKIFFYPEAFGNSGN